MRIVVCSGGTGGHMFPACALFETLGKRGHDVSMVTDTRGASFCKDVQSKEIVEAAALHKVVGAFIKFIKMWSRDRPDVVVGFGGAFTVIPMLAARCLGSKIVIYEQNSVIGKANRLLSLVSHLKLSFFDVGKKWRCVPSPVRKEFVKCRHVPYSCDGNIKIVVISGSQGARSFSHIIPDAIGRLEPDLRKKLEIVQQVGSEERNGLKAKYVKLGIKFSLENFLHQMAEEMSTSQLVICRSGASTLAELSTIGRPAILIPYPQATDNHQVLNATNYVRKDAAWMVEEKADASEKISLIITEVLANRELLKSAASNMIDNSADGRDSLFAELIENV